MNIFFGNGHYNHQPDRDYDRSECTSIRRYSGDIITNDAGEEDTNNRKDWKPIRVLLIEDQPDEARLIRELLSDVPESQFHFILEWADRLETGLERLRERTQGHAQRTPHKKPEHNPWPVDIILLDLLLPQSEGAQTFTRVYDLAPHIPIIVLSGMGDQELAVQIVQAGAQDYLVKGHFDRELLIRAIRYAIQRKRTEEALRESESRYYAIAELTSDFAYSIAVLPDNKLALEWTTKTCEQATGYNLQEIIQYGRWRDLIHPDDLPSLAYHLQTRLAGRSSVVELRVATADGRYLWIRDRGRPVWDDHERRVIRIYGAAQDITAYKQAEQALRESEERLRTQYKHIPIPTYNWQKAPKDPAGNDEHTLDFILVDYNDAAWQITEGKIADIIGVRASQFYADTPRIIADLTRCYREKTSIEREMLYRYRTTGKLRHFSIKYAFVPPDTVMVHTEDITARKRAEQDLARRAAQLTLLSSIGREITAVLKLEHVLQRAVQLIHESFDYHYVAIYSMDHEHNKLLLKAQSGNVMFPISPEQHRKLTAGMIGWVARYGETIVANDVRKEPRYINLWPDRLRTRSAICVPIRMGQDIFGVLDVQSDQCDAFDQHTIIVLETLADQIAIAVKNAQLFQEVHTSRERLQALSHRLVETQETERRHIARELHDEIGQVLTGLKLLLNMTGRMPTHQIQQNLMEAQKLVNELMVRVRDMSLDLRPAMLDDLGLLPTLLWHFERYTNQTGVQVTFKHTAMKERRFPTEIETAAYRIIQEALTNVARHADTDRVTVRVWADEEQLHIQVVDEGVGFDPDAVLQTGNSNGLNSMLERTALLGGNLVIEASPGAGTHILVELPLASPPSGMR